MATLTARIIHNIDASTVVEVKTADFYDLIVAPYEHYKSATTKTKKKIVDAKDVELQNRKNILGEIRNDIQGLQILPDEDVKKLGNKRHIQS